MLIIPQFATSKQIQAPLNTKSSDAPLSASNTNTLEVSSVKKNQDTSSFTKSPKFVLSN